jgi:hypothetical protein
MGKPKLLDQMSKASNINSTLNSTKYITDFSEINRVRTELSELATLNKAISPTGISYSIEGDALKDSLSCNLFAQQQIFETDTKSIYAYVSNYIDDAVSVKKISPTPFEIPSGQLDNAESPAAFSEYFTKDDYCHPDIAYDATGVAGYKYWMVSSILPQYNDTASWEDEDVFVTNENPRTGPWYRIKSLYEDARDDTATGLSLPPHTLETTTGRKHALLPIPAAGDQIEISAPADNGGAELDRVTITLTGLPFKHDPCILIDGGYVYIYLSYHLSYVDRPGGKNKFIVCLRTNDGVSWESVRNDGSALVITEESSRQLFTKDAQGRYNYMHYLYDNGSKSPCVKKYGTGDYELVYGSNFSVRYKGTTPYNFDFSTPYTFQNLGSANHPGLLVSGSDLYLINSEGFYHSTNRGETFTKYDHYPAWIGGIEGYAYKKAMCIGADGKVFLVEAQRQTIPDYRGIVANQFSSTGRSHQLYITEYASLSDLISKATDGLEDSYIDVQITKVNIDEETRYTRFYPYIGNLNSTSVVNSPLQRIKICDFDVEYGDVLMICVTLNSRNGAKIIFGGLEIS